MAVTEAVTVVVDSEMSGVVAFAVVEVAWS